ncbi:MAG: phosphoenolpyruvate--protein phosphotransferase [Candidatus Cloacimonetes bacterium 4572_55]|nr:MAG: phosphoenolpyruvate--protein phosphotransferase [Candidatus Cloacimonetes bacterium 4572_55]
MENKNKIQKNVILNGIAASPGIAQGEAYLYFRNEIPIEMRNLGVDDVPGEVERFLSAIEKSKKEILVLRQEYINNTGAIQEGMIFEAHALILEDPQILEKTIAGIERTNKNAEFCFNLAVNSVIDMFSNMKNEFFRERALDIIDIRRRILRNLSNIQHRGLSNLPKPVIVVSHDLGPSDTASIDKKNVKAIVTDLGGHTSHSVIIARSMGLPAVVALADITGRVKHGDTLIVDGSMGQVILQPTKEKQNDYQERQKDIFALSRSLQQIRDKPAITRDGVHIELSANIEAADEAEDVIKHGANGVGLLRTEFLCLQRGEFPSEEEQYELYSAIIETVSPQSVVIRTYDLGGDKFALLQDTENEQNPFLGWRAIRFCLDHPRIFKAQLRAILRAGAKGNIKIMLPFICDVGEVIISKKYLKEVEQELLEAGIPFCQDYELGVMIETPSAAISGDILAPKIDFFSIGTNDLTQYLLAVDRGNEKVARYYDPLNPSVIRSIKNVVKYGHAAGIWVGICGEIAADPLVAYLLIGLGIDELSISPIFIPDVKRLIRSMNFSDARFAAQQVLRMSGAREIKCFLAGQLEGVRYF